MGRCATGFSGKGGQGFDERDVSFNGTEGHVIQELGFMGSREREAGLVLRLGTVRRKQTGCPGNRRVSTSCEEVGCTECTSSFLIKVVKDGRSTRRVGRSVGGFLTSELTLRLSSRGALIARAREPTGFLKCRVAMEGSGSREQSGQNELEEACNGEIYLGIDARAIHGGLFS